MPSQTIRRESAAASAHKRETDYETFAPERLVAFARPPSPLPRITLYLIVAILASAAAAIVYGEIDVVAVAPGKLVPQSLLRIVQPSDSGVVREILVREGEAVLEGEVLFRMDTELSEADGRILETEIALRRLQIRRIDAELSGAAFERSDGDRDDLHAQVQAQFYARRRAFEDSLAAERSALAKAQQDLRSAQEIEAKLKRTAPIYVEQEKAWEKLAREGFAGKLLALERRRSRIENEQDLQAQRATVMSSRAAIAMSERRIAQLASNHRRELNNERVEAQAQLERLQEDLTKQAHRSGQLELRAPSAGVIKDLATHSTGTVVAPATILATIVPRNEPLEAEVWVSNLDAGRVAPGAPVRLKLAAFPYQRYGMLEGSVRHMSADATERPDPANGGAVGLYYRALVSIDRASAPVGLDPQRLVSGMQLAAEIHLGTRTLFEYLLSPVRRTLSEAGRES
ncbi:MAG: HlyD family type I secretion periplasmic adaptor subunit [Burkholderiales bacterium]